MIIPLLIIIVIIVYFSRTYATLLFSNSHKRHYKKGREFQRRSQKARIVLLFPLYKEQKLLSYLNQTVNNIQQSTELEIEIFLITSNREQSNRDGQSTYSCLKEFKWERNVYLINLSNHCVGKGAALNEFFRINREFENDTWIGVYDVDSTPEMEIFEFINSQEEHIKIIQQPSIYLKNIQNLSRLIKPLALYQTFWSIGTETRRINKYQRLLNKNVNPVYFPYLYPVGHGIFYRYSTLQKLSFFHNVYEDLRIGIPILLNKENLIVAPYFDYCSFVADYKTFRNQSMSWCNGSWLIWEDLKKINKNKGYRFRLSAFSITLKGTINNLHWSFEAIIILVCNALFLIFGKGFLLLLLTSIFTSLEYFLLLRLQYLYNKITGIMPKPRVRIFDFFFGNLRVYLYGVGPALGSLKFLKKLRANTSWVTESTIKDAESG